MIKFISIIFYVVLLSSCTHYVNVLQKLDKDTALLQYPCTKDEYGTWNYGKIYYVEDDILRNYADNDKLTGCKIEKIPEMTYSYVNLMGYQYTVNCGQLIEK